MKKSRIFTFISIFLLTGMAISFAADPPKEMRLLLVRGNKLIGSKGSMQGVASGNKYDIIRQGPYGEEKIGVAQVLLTKSSKCGLKVIESQPGSEVKKGDLLRLVLSEEESIMAEMDALLQEGQSSATDSDFDGGSGSTMQQSPDQGSSDYGPPPQKYTQPQRSAQTQPAQQSTAQTTRRTRPSTRIPYADKPPMLMAFHGGMSMTLAPEMTKEWWPMGFAFNGDFSYPFSRLFSAMAGVGFSQLAFDEDGYSDYYNSITGNWGVPATALSNIQIDIPDLQIIELLLGIRFGQPYMGERFRFYLCGGPGYYIMDASVDMEGALGNAGAFAISDSKLGFWGGAEVFLGLTDKLVLTFNPRYHLVLTEGDALSYVQGTLGIAYALR